MQKQLSYRKQDRQQRLDRVLAARQQSHLRRDIFHRPQKREKFDVRDDASNDSSDSDMFLDHDHRHRERETFDVAGCMPTLWNSCGTSSRNYSTADEATTVSEVTSDYQRAHRQHQAAGQRIRFAIDEHHDKLTDTGKLGASRSQYNSSHNNVARTVLVSSAHPKSINNSNGKSYTPEDTCSSTSTLTSIAFSDEEKASNGQSNIRADGDLSSKQLRSQSGKSTPATPTHATEGCRAPPETPMTVSISSRSEMHDDISVSYDPSKHCLSDSDW
jgi:hypothetical protein